MTPRDNALLEIMIADFSDDLSLYLGCFAAAFMEGDAAQIELNNFLVSFARARLRIQEIGER